MLARSVNFEEKNQSLNKKPRWVIAISFDTADTDVHYFTSHNDCEVPAGTSTANIHYNVLRNPIVSSQKLDVRKAKSSIGNIQFQLIDKSNAITDLLNTKDAAGYGVRHKRVVAYRGYEGLAWDDYYVPPGGTQIISGKLSSDRGKYYFRAKDRQRSAKKDVFDNKKTTLTAAYTAGDTTLSVVSTADFEMVAHGTSYSDAPSSTVGYVEIEGVAFRYTGKTATTFTGVVGGVLNTRDVDIDVDTTASADRRPEVKEVIYLEMPAPKMAYAIYTNSLYGQSASIPDHWGLEISTDYIATSLFTSIGVDLWDTTDDTKGFVLRFDSLEKRDAKRFIQEQLLEPMGVFPRVLSDGQLGLKRMSSVTPDASPVAVLDETNVMAYRSLDHDLDSVANLYILNWNRERSKGKTTRTNAYVDTSSVSKNQEADVITRTYEGLHGSRHVPGVIHNVFDNLRNRFADAPELIQVDCHQSLNGLEIGDIVWCNFNQRDFVGGGNLNRAFEVQGYHDNGKKITLTLFGSTAKAGAISPTSASTVLTSTFYTSGLNAGNKLDAALTTTFTGGVLHVTANGTLTGGADATDVNNIYWYDGHVQIDDGVDVTWTNNIQIRCHSLTTNGNLLGNGQGHSGVAGGGGTDYNDGTAGALGYCESGGGCRSWSRSGGGYRVVSRQGGSVDGTWDAIPVPILTNNGTSIDGMWTDLRGCSGSSGGSIYRCENCSTEDAYGGTGGDGGAGIIIVARNVYSGVNGRIDVSGTDGALGTVIDASVIGSASEYMRSGSGAGGSPGGVLVLIDGNGTSTATVWANQGDTPIGGRRLPQGYTAHMPNGTNYSYHIGTQGEIGGQAVSHLNTNYLLHYIPAQETPEEDVAEETSVPTAISITPVTATLASLNTTYFEISVTPPSDGNYYGSRIMIAQNGTDGWHDLGIVRSTDEVVTPPVFPGITYEVRAYPISITGVQSEDYASDTQTVTASLETILGANYSLVTQTDPATNGGISLTANSLTAYDSGGVARVTIDASTGLITATNAVLSGTITATAGAIGGWDINSNHIDIGTGAAHMELNPSTGIWLGDDLIGNAPFSVTPAGVLTAESGTIGGWTLSATTLSNADALIDAGNERIQIGPTAGSYFRVDTATGLTLVDNTLGTVFDVPLDGSAPTFASGVINTTTFNITSSGILETSANAGNGTTAGVRINDTGIKLWNNSSTTPTIHLNAATGAITFNNWSDVSGTGVPDANADVTSANAQPVSWLTDAGALATLDTIGTTQIDANAVTTPKIAANAVTATEINVASLSAISAALGTVTSGTIQTSRLLTATSGQRIDLNPSSDNELHFYGNNGTTVEELCRIGISAFGGDNVVLNVGSSTTTNARMGILARSYSAEAIYAQSNSDYAIQAISNNSTAINASAGGSGYGGAFAGGTTGAPVLLGASASATAPSHSVTKGALWVTSGGHLYINYDGSTGWKHAGAVVQVVNTSNSAVSSGTTSMPYDDTVPQNTEGFEVMTRSIAPTATGNKLKIEVVVNASGAGNTQITAALFQDSTASALAAATKSIGTANRGEQIVFTHYMDAGTTSATTFKVRIGTNGTSNCTFNGESSSSTRRLGNVMASSITITEIVP